MALATALTVGFLAGAGLLERTAQAQGGAASPPAQRFQISAWSFAAGQGVGIRAERGCYIVDTATGELWHAQADLPARKVSDKVRQGGNP